MFTKTVLTDLVIASRTPQWFGTSQATPAELRNVVPAISCGELPS